MPRHPLPPRPFIPALNCARVELFYSVNLVTAENVFHVSKGSPYSPSDLVTLRNTVNTWDSSTWLNARGVGCSLFRIRCTALDTAGSPVDDYLLPTARAGSVSGTLLPANAAFCIKIATALAGRSYRGRWYTVGMTTGFLGATSNQIASGTASAYITDLGALKTALTGAGSTIGVLSYATGMAWRTTAHFEPATGFVAVDLNIDSQRRRLTGRGI